MHVCRIKGRKIARCGPQKYNKTEGVIRFEQVFYEQFNRQLAKYGPQCFEQAQMKCLEIQKVIVFK